MQKRKKVPTKREEKKEPETNFPFRKGEVIKVRIGGEIINAIVLGAGKPGYIFVKVKEAHKRAFKSGDKEKLRKLEAEMREVKIELDRSDRAQQFGIIGKIARLDKKIGLLLYPPPVTITRTKSVPIDSVVKQKEQSTAKPRKGQVSKTQRRNQRRKELIRQAIERAGWREHANPKRVRRELQRKGIFGVNPKPGRKRWMRPR